jgi:hypothetical protein
MACGRISLLDFWTFLFLSQGHQIISPDLYDIQLSADEAWRLLLCSGFLYNLALVSYHSISPIYLLSHPSFPKSEPHFSSLTVSLSLEQLALKFLVTSQLGK